MRKLTELGLILGFGFLQVFGELPFEGCEFAVPEMKHDYWPVLPGVPKGTEGDQGLWVDYLVGKNGRVLGTAIISEVTKEEADLLKIYSQFYQFSPSVTCGEVTDGFFRHQIRSYFYPELELGEKLDRVPIARWALSNDVRANIDYLAGVIIGKQRFHLIYDIDEEGRVRKVSSEDAKEDLPLTVYLEGLSELTTFEPAVRDGEAIAVRLNLVFHLESDTRSDGKVEVFERFPQRKPLPRIPKNVELDDEEVHQAILTYNASGTVDDIQFLTPIRSELLTASLQAFRAWKSELPGKNGRDLLYQQSLVSLSFIPGEEQAILLEEKFDQYLFTLPKPIERKSPIFPSHLARKGTGGYVVATFVVMKDGSVTQIEEEIATHPAFWKSAEKALKGWIFEPATVNGEPVAMRVRQSIPFGFNQ